MAFETPNFDFIEEEQDLQLWAAELGVPYEFGAQGTVDQPPREMVVGRIEAQSGQKEQHYRELGGLPAIIDDEERELRVTIRQLARMTEDEQEEWHERADDWLSRHPQALKYSLMDRPPKLH